MSTPRTLTQPPSATKWIPVAEMLPEPGVEVWTKIHDKDGCRNKRSLKLKGNLWWLPDMITYVYYRPTHWAVKEANEQTNH